MNDDPKTEEELEKAGMRNGMAGVSGMKQAPFQAKSVSADGFFEGYASIFGAEDLGHDIVMPGAFRRSLERRGARGVKMLYQHDPNEVIGCWEEIREDRQGLFVRGQLLQDVARAREVLALMRAGAVDGLSIGYHMVRAENDRKNGARRLLEVDLWEISVVTFPMQPTARVRAVKAGRPTVREFERWLMRDAGFSRMEARTVIHKGFKALPPHETGRRGDAALARAIRLAARLFDN